MQPGCSSSSGNGLPRGAPEKKNHPTVTQSNWDGPCGLVLSLCSRRGVSRLFAIYAVFFWFPDDSETPIRAVRYVDRLAWSHPIRNSAVRRNAYRWMASDRKRERHWHSAVPLFVAAGRLWGLYLRPSSTLLTIVSFSMVGAAWVFRFWAIPTEILCVPTSASGGRNDQCDCQHRRLCLTLRIRDICTPALDHSLTGSQC